tara:strand:+ start:4658 stop:5287 length:630 start_codon:yes stop_codon:yes gene_type:complete
MSNSKKGSLFVNIGARVGGFKKGLDRSMRMLRGYKKRISKMMPKMPGGMLGMMGMGLGLTGMMGVLMNSSPKFAKAVSKITDQIVNLAAPIGDALAPMLSRLADALPGIVDNVLEFGQTLVEGYQLIQSKLEDFASKATEAVLKFVTGVDPSKATNKEEIELLRQIRDKLVAEGKPANVSAVVQRMKFGQTSDGQQRQASNPLLEFLGI